MEIEWNKRPMVLENIPMGVRNILAVDESGTTCKVDVEEDWLSLTGIILNSDNFLKTESSIMTLKNKYWEDALFFNKRVVLHSRDIQKRQRAFSQRIIENIDDFETDLQEMISNVEMKIISSNIDKNRLYENYFNPYDTYELSVEFMVERFLLYLEKQGETGVIVFESRGRKEDNRILCLIDNLIKYGNDYISNTRFQKWIEGVFFNKKHTKDYTKSYWVLELADICSGILYKKMKKEETELFSCIQNKIIGYPNYNGKGMKIFPK